VFAVAVNGPHGMNDVPGGQVKRDGTAVSLRTQGQYDSFVIAEVPSEEIGMQLLLAAGMQGNGRSETLRAFSEDEMAQIVAKLP